MENGILFHKEGPKYDKVFCPVLVLQKGCLLLAKLFLTISIKFKLHFVTKTSLK